MKFSIFIVMESLFIAIINVNCIKHVNETNYTD